MPPPSPPLPLPLLLLLLLLPLPAVAHAISLRACVPPFIPVHARSSPSFAALRARSFLTATTLSPTFIAPVTRVAHIAPLLRCARRANLRVCPRSGGHSLTAASLCGPRALLLDLSALRAVALSAGVARIQPGANIGEVLWKLWQRGRRWLAAGVCPSVGMGGYVLGGGHGPYEGRLGMACDALVAVRFVDRFGNPGVASRKNNPSLFWAMCGAGGSQFVIVTELVMRTVSAKPFDNAAAFRFRWPIERAGELLEKWTRYGESGGDVWFRIEIYLDKSGERGVYGYGACYNVSGGDQCLQRLRKAAFFTVPGRETVYLAKTRNALDYHAFLGPEGGWGRRRAGGDLARAFIRQRGTSGGGANGRSYQSTFLSPRNGKMPGKGFWQEYAEFCARPGRESLPWVVCEMSLFGNAINRKMNNAFAHRGARVITHYIIGGGTAGDQKFAYGWMKRHLKPFTSGVYVNYPERALGKTYARMYWGRAYPG